MGISPAPNPKIWIGDEHHAFSRKIIPDGMKVIGIGPGASHLFKRWPAENFAELCEKLIAPDGPYPDAKIAIIGSPNELGPAKVIFDRLPVNRVIDLMSGTDLIHAAAAIERMTLYIGNDHGLMHMSAAIGTRTIGLFGPTPPTHYRPWGEKSSYVSSDRSQGELAAIEKRIGRDSECLMEELKVNAVVEALPWRRKK
jgi:ADP-heptose:LPS heptosyltransferase